AGGLGHAKVNDFGHWPAVHEPDQDIGRLQVAVDDALLVSVLHGLTNGYEELTSLAGRQPLLVAIGRDGDALDQLHDEIGPARRRPPSVVHLGDAWVVHQGQRLPLLFKAGDHLRRVHARPNDFDGDAPADRLLLLRGPDLAHAALAEAL